MTTKNYAANLEQINNDLKSFLDFCKENHLTNEEIAKICLPLTTTIKNAKIFRVLSYFMILFLIITIFYYFMYFETVSWNLSAIGRILLIKLLPYWDWRSLKNEKCLIPNFIDSRKDSLGQSFDCAFCEAIDKIYMESHIDPTFLNSHYIELHKPVILFDALENWPIYHNPDLSLNEDRTIYNSLPCKLSTNIHNGLVNLGKILRKTEEFDEYFLHFQNCNFEATKAFRVFSPRPHFLPAEISPVQYSWLMMSRKYNVTSYKPVQLREAITVIGQVVGSNFFRLLPRQNCENECPVLEIELFKGEALVFTSLWDLKYKPSPAGENIAVILEMH